MRRIILLFILISSMTFGQNANELFQKANKLYKEGKYQDAKELYVQIIEANEISSEVFFNLGNCYYKLNQVAPSILNYEKALLLNPRNEDAQNNLIIANRLTLDRIEALPQTLLQKLEINLLDKFHFNTWAVIVVLLSFTGTILFLLFYFSFSSNKKRLYFITSILSFVLFILTLLATFKQYNKEMRKNYAIIFPTEVSIHNEPTKDSEEIFTLHEGTKILILDKVDNWSKIKLVDGKIGWILTNEIAPINNFKFNVKT